MGSKISKPKAELDRRRAVEPLPSAFGMRFGVGKTEPQSFDVRYGKDPKTGKKRDAEGNKIVVGFRRGATRSRLCKTGLVNVQPRWARPHSSSRSA